MEGEREDGVGDDEEIQMVMLKNDAGDDVKNDAGDDAKNDAGDDAGDDTGAEKLFSGQCPHSYPS